MGGGGEGGRGGGGGGGGRLALITCRMPFRKGDSNDEYHRRFAANPRGFRYAVDAVLEDG